MDHGVGYVQDSKRGVGDSARGGAAYRIRLGGAGRTGFAFEIDACRIRAVKSEREPFGASLPAALSKITCLRRWPRKLRSGHGAPRSGAAASPAYGLRLRPRPPFTPCALARSCWWLMRWRCACELLARWHSAGVSAPRCRAAHLSIATSCAAVL